MWTCQDCGKEFDFEKGVYISYEAIKCKECKKIWQDKILVEDRKLSVFHFTPFFDQSLGVYVESYSHKKQLEREHKVEYMSNDERISATKEAKRHIEDKKSSHIRKNITEIRDNIRKGHSYIEDLKKEM